MNCHPTRARRVPWRGAPAPAERSRDPRCKCRHDRLSLATRLHLSLMQARELSVWRQSLSLRVWREG